MNDQFWMICRAPTGPQSKTEPRHRYRSLAEARTAAERFAQEQDHPFLILAPTATVLPTDRSAAGLFNFD